MREPSDINDMRGIVSPVSPALHSGMPSDAPLANALAVYDILLLEIAAPEAILASVILPLKAP
jgi:hypothetical protein